MLRGRAFIFVIRVPYYKAFPIEPNFERVTFTVTFDLILNIGYNFLTVRNWVFIFAICVPYMSVLTFPVGQWHIF